MYIESVLSEREGKEKQSHLQAFTRSSLHNIQPGHVSDSKPC